MELIMNRNKKASKIGTVAAVLASVILSGTTVFAYTPMQTVKDSTHTNEDYISFDFNIEAESLFSNYDTYFETMDGIIIPITTTNSNERAIFCSHNFKSGYVNKHYSQTNGGCMVKRYTGKICMKCNHIEVGDYISTTTYAKCPH